MKLTDKGFLADTGSGRYVMYIDGNAVHVTSVPSAASEMSYADADAVVRRLRARRTAPMAIVTTLDGQPVTSGMLDEIRNGKRDDSSPLPDFLPLPKTLAELNRLPVAQYKERYRNDAVFREIADRLENV